MNRLKAIVLDVDDTLLDFTGGFRDYANEYYGFGMEGMPIKYSFEGWLPCDMGLKRQIMARFNTSWQFGCLEPLPGAWEALIALRFLNTTLEEPLKLILVSKCGRDSATKALRKANLTHVFGRMFDDIILIDYEESKSHILTKLKRNYNIVLSVDDYVLNCVDMVKLDIPTVVMRHSTNINITSRYPTIPVVKNWNHLFNQYIRALFGVPS